MAAASSTSVDAVTSSEFVVNWDGTTRITDDALAVTLSKSVVGPSLQGAVYARFVTSFSAANYLGPLGCYLIARPAAAMAAAEVTKSTGMPLDATVIFGVNSEALFIWSSDPMLSLVKQYLGAVPRSSIVSVTTNAGTSWQKVIITLSNGGVIDMEARGGVHAFVSAFHSQRED